MDIDPPKLINQDNEALSFTWSDKQLKQYLTISVDELDMMHLSKNSYIRCEELISAGNEIDYKSLIQHPYFSPRSTSISEEE